jgi:hypothetical protein
VKYARRPVDCQTCNSDDIQRPKKGFTHRPHVSAVVESDIGQDDALPVVEADVEVPFLPVDGAAVQFERHTFGLGDVNWLEIIPEANLFLDGLVIKIGRRCFVEGSAFFGNVNVNDLLCLDVENGAKVERVSILKVVDAGSVVHQSLLKSRAIGVAFIVAFRNN